MKIVLDTNVLISGLLTPFGSSGEILRIMFSGELALCLDARILAEYKDVLHRPKFKWVHSKLVALMKRSILFEHIAYHKIPSSGKELVS